jgi:hypothetical protein
LTPGQAVAHYPMDATGVPIPAVPPAYITVDPTPAIPIPTVVSAPIQREEGEIVERRVLRQSVSNDLGWVADYFAKDEMSGNGR